MTPRLQRWAGSGLLTLASVVLALSLVEVGLRLGYPQPTGLSHQDPYGLAMHWPGITRRLPLYGTTVSFNSAGMRDREHVLEKPDGVFRVLLLGDSFMEALQVPFEASFPSLLERDLARRTGKPIEVVSAGVSGWGTDDELRYLTSYGLEYRPDLVVVAMTLHNDISDNLREYWHTVRDETLVEQPHLPAPFVQYKIVELKAFLASHLQSYQLWRKVRHGREMRQTGRQLSSHVVELFHEPTPDGIARGFQLTGLLLARMKTEISASGGQMVIVLLPLRVQLSDSSWAEFIRSAGGNAGAMQNNKPQRVVTDLADSLGIPVIDLLPTFRRWTADSSAPLYLEWDGHWNETGHRVAAEAVAQGLEQRATER